MPRRELAFTGTCKANNSAVWRRRDFIFLTRSLAHHFVHYRVDTDGLFGVHRPVSIRLRVGAGLAETRLRTYPPLDDLLVPREDFPDGPKAHKKALRAEAR